MTAPGNGFSAPSRRAVLAGATALIGAGLGSGRNVRAQAAGSVHEFKVGPAVVTVFSDGVIDLPVGLMLPGRDQPDIDAVFAKAGRSFAGLRSEINVAVIKIGAEVILVDTGGGPDFMATLGNLSQRMELAGVTADAVTKVIFTHAHPDHLWGAIDPLGGGAMYEKARHMMTAAEFDFWMTPDVETRVPVAFRGMAAGTHRRLTSIAERIEKVAPGAEIAPGVQIIDTAGHTPGHVSVLVGPGTDQLLIGSDVLTQYVISFAAPDWRWGADMDNDKAVAARHRILDRLATDRTRLLGYHLPWPGLGYVERKDGAYRFVPA